jgi:hypothetical protein
MNEQPLAEMIGSGLDEVAGLAQRHRSGQESAAVRERLLYLHSLLRSLEEELLLLREEAGDDVASAALWQKTVAELRSGVPEQLRAPASALVAGDLDLLRLVEYTAASAALVRERRASLRRPSPPDLSSGADLSLP